MFDYRWWSAVATLVVLLTGNESLRTPRESEVKMLADLLSRNSKLMSPSYAVLLLCDQDGWKNTTMRIFSAGIPCEVTLAPEHWLQSVLRAQKSAQTTVLLDVSCAEAAVFLQRANGTKLMDAPNRWILFNARDTSLQPTESGFENSAPSKISTSDPITSPIWINETKSCYERAELLLTNIKILVDSNILVTCKSTWKPDTFNVYSVYRINLEDQLRASLKAQWSASRGITYFDTTAISEQRKNLHGYHIKLGFVLMFPSKFERNLKEYRNTPDVITTMNWDVMNSVVDMLNATKSTSFGRTWGYAYPNGSATGLVDMMRTRQVELTGTAMAMLLNRMVYVDFLNYATPARGVFVFREPPVTLEYNLFTLPFPRSLWLCSGGLVLLSSALLLVTVKTEDPETSQPVTQAASKQGARANIYAWSDVLLVVVGAICQQGSPLEARGISGRIVTIFLFAALLFLYTSYSASIVSLLQSTSTPIRHYRDFLDSRIKIGADEAAYAKPNILRDDSVVGKRMLAEKLTKKGKVDGFMNISTGVHRARTEYFAFHSMETVIYAEISDTWTENEKCGIREIASYLNLNNPLISAGKWSPHRKLFRVALRKLQERGIRKVMVNRYLKSKPACVKSGGQFQSASINDVRGAFQVLAILYGLAILVFILENIIYVRLRKRPDIRQILVRSAVSSLEEKPYSSESY